MQVVAATRAVGLEHRKCEFELCTLKLRPLPLFSPLTRTKGNTCLASACSSLFLFHSSSPPRTSRNQPTCNMVAVQRVTCDTCNEIKDKMWQIEAIVSTPTFKNRLRPSHAY